VLKRQPTELKSKRAERNDQREERKLGGAIDEKHGVLKRWSHGPVFIMKGAGPLAKSSISFHRHPFVLGACTGFCDGKPR
jgi:hypothetical protein